MNSLVLSLFGALAISSISIIGIVSLSVKDNILRKILFTFVSFSAGALLGGAFLHLLPEAIADFGQPKTIFIFTLIGLSVFFLIEYILRWHHCHDVNCASHPRYLGYLNLIGDGVHNLIDGVIIFSAFTASPALGWPVLLSLALHEIPQEIGDYGLLLYVGFSKSRALLYNLLSALLAIAGVFLGYLLISQISALNNFLLPFAAGGFIYIATSDLIPELHKETNRWRLIISFIIFFLALMLMLFLS